MSDSVLRAAGSHAYRGGKSTAVAVASVVRRSFDLESALITVRLMNPNPESFVAARRVAGGKG